MINAVIFDLDDTLYLESEYVLSGFNAVAEYLSVKYGISKYEIYIFLKNQFLTHGREKIFNYLYHYLLAKIIPDNEAGLVEELVTVYRNHEPTIVLEKNIVTGLLELRNNYDLKLGLLTDGLPLMQKKKVLALGIEDYFDEIVYSWEIGCPKPHVDGINYLLAKLGTTSKNTIMVGDNPSHDIEPAVTLSMPSIRVLTGRFKCVASNACYGADVELSSMSQVFIEIKKCLK
ncbi:HAD family hydrolase [Hydrogenovibrio sp. SC-1]|uniref:HAD family hydrolase n=1 Tax=Hydrogenovibrio sp. SC-1 TaxID=2065820 RepID=UPI00130443DF|nr:HAD-IA family hydrolase [Hydrogenovibrio sp. SC-1]